MNERDRNRRDFPEAARFMDELRRVFGDGVKLRWWKENGRTIGQVPEQQLGAGNAGSDYS